MYDSWTASLDVQQRDRVPKYLIGSTFLRVDWTFRRSFEGKGVCAFCGIDIYLRNHVDGFVNKGFSAHPSTVW